MKNITAFAVFVIIPHFILYAQTDTYTLSTAFQSGVLYGQAEEIVYSDPADQPLRTNADKLSQLLWDMKPVFYYGLVLDYAPVDPFAQLGFFIDLNLKTAVPDQKSGSMEDRDWMSTENYALTAYSKHDVVTNDFFDITVKTGASFPFHANWLITAYAAIAYTRFVFSGKDGSGTYANDIDGNPFSGFGLYKPIDDNPTKYTFSDTVISYTQEWVTISPGISVKSRFFTVLSAELFFQISPLVFCGDLDTHETRQLQFLDDMNGGLGMEGGLTLSWAIRQWLTLSLEGSYRHIKGTRGTTYSRRLDGNDDFTEVGEAGAGLDLFDSRIVIKVRF